LLNCPACGSPLREEPLFHGVDRLHGTPGAFSVRGCPACGSGSTFPPAGPEELERFYPDSYNAYVLPRTLPLRVLATMLFRWRYFRALRRPPLVSLRATGPGRVLDVGAGRGDLGIVLRGSGWHVTGLEPSASACIEGRRRGLEMIEGTLATADVSELGAPFDAVVFQHSLEHLAEPGDDLIRARSLLREGGLLVISVPNFGSWQSRTFESAWFHLDLPRHRVHFTPEGLERLLLRSGFGKPRLTTSTTADGLPMSLQYRLLGRRRISTGVPLYLMFGLSLALVPLTVAVNALSGGGDQLNASAVRVPTPGLRP
jgi:SAM-dependent methyltransferase